MLLSVQPNSRKEKIRNPQLSQCDPVTQNNAPERCPRAPYLKRYKLM